MILQASTHWLEVFSGPAERKLMSIILPKYLKQQRWFGSKSKTIRTIAIAEQFDIGLIDSRLLILKIMYHHGVPDHYLFPISFASKLLVKFKPPAIIAKVQVNHVDGYLYDGIHNGDVRRALFARIAQGMSVRHDHGILSGCSSRKSLTGILSPIQSTVGTAEQSNSSIIYNNRFFLKLYRRLQPGTNPDLEITRYLTEQTDYRNVPAFAGSLEYRVPGREPMLLGLLQDCVPARSDAWVFSLNAVDNYYSRVKSGKLLHRKPDTITESAGRTLMGPHYLTLIQLLGQRTAELHRALAKGTGSLKPVNYSAHQGHALSRSIHKRVITVTKLLKSYFPRLPAPVQPEAALILRRQTTVSRLLKQIARPHSPGLSIRIHGDYHLGQVLFTGSDFMIIDFEGEPMRPLRERREPGPALRDVAGMLRSFHYAAYFGLFRLTNTNPKAVTALTPWAEHWCRIVSAVFLSAYRVTIGTGIVPADNNEFDALLKVLLLDKAYYELEYELNNRPGWVLIPLRGIRQLTDIIF